MTVVQPTDDLRIPISSFALDNGLRISVSEDHATPIVAVNIWYHVGSANERSGRTGFAHLFEHMLFQGSANVGANEHFELIERAGGALNGSTWLDRTNYFETVPSHQLEPVLWLEADRMGALLPAMTQAKLDTQRDVVKNERRWTVDNQPYGTWWERLPALAFPQEHPFHHSLIGSMDDLDAATLEDVADFFRTFYTPDNAVLTVAGDVDRDTVPRLVERYFGSIPRGPGRPPLPRLDVDSRFGSSSRLLVEDRVAAPRMFLAFRSPTFGSGGYYAASVCGAIMGMKTASRLHRNLVRHRRVASSASAFTFDLAKGSDLLVFDVTAKPGVTVAGIEEAVLEQLEELRRDGVTEREVERATTLIATQHVVSLESAGSRADAISKFATYFDDPTLVNDQARLYRAINTSAVNDFIDTYLGFDNRATLMFVPSGDAAPEATT